METAVVKLYEGMFLVDSALAASDWDGVNKTIKDILEKSGAEVLSIRKWDERKLAYQIGPKNRGTYLLCYFRVDGTKIQVIERDIQLSENIVRAMILNVDHFTQEDMDKATPAMSQERRAEDPKDSSDEEDEDSQEEVVEESAE